MKKIQSRILKRQLGEAPRDAVLRILQLHGESSIAELCKAMKVTDTAVRRQLSALMQEGRISCRQDQCGAGRPVHRYKLIEAAAQHVPSGYETLAAGLLDDVFERSGHPGVMEVLRANNEYQFQLQWKQLTGKTLAERVESVARYFADQGYMTKWTTLQDGNFFLYHQTCAIYNLAVRYRQLCILEPRLIERLLGAKVTRQQYILKNQPICGYLVDSGRPTSGSDASH